jgi:Tripartite tricarboxylate transporter TctB family
MKRDNAMQKLMDRDLLAGLVLFAIGSVALANSGSDLMNWAFPLMATYFIMFAAAVLVGRAILAAVKERAPDAIRVSAEDRIIWLDVLIFLLIALVYLMVMYGLGFWLSSFLMLSLVSLYLTKDKTRHNMALAVIAPLAACLLAYVVFEHVFYVPLPDPTWLPGLG